MAKFFLSSMMVAFAVNAATASRLSMKVDSNGQVSVGVGAKTWFNQGNISVTVGGMLYSTSDGSLKKDGSATQSSDNDGFGSYTATTQKWMAASTPYVTAVRSYNSGSMMVFSQTWPSGAQGTNGSAGGKQEVSSCYPSIDPTPPDNATYGFVSWEGRFAEASRGGVWQDGTGQGQPGVGHGNAGGPFVVFGSENPITDSMVVSSVSNFMTNTPGQSPVKNDNSFCFGLDVPVSEVPAGYTLETMFMAGTGINTAMKGFGTKLLHYYNNTRLDDYTRHHLGFSTDNGAYYYYNTEPGKFAPGKDKKTYQDTLLDVHAYAEKEKIPFKHVLLDSWWYTKGDAGGLKEWDATNSTFPDGLKSFAEKTGWKFQMHNRMWSQNNVYATQNGGKYTFDFDADTKFSVPNDQMLWDDLISNKTENGVPMSVYEQDWMYNEWEGVSQLRSSPTLGRQWLMQMGKGAEKANVGVQYCMTYPRMLLQTAEIPAVTTFRASDDYGPGQTGYYKHIKNPNGTTGCTFPYCVYYVGTTSILANAMQLGPSKDNYWSTPVQPGSAFNHGRNPTFYNDTIEPYNEMQGAISSYTTAMVATSDGVGYSNSSLINMHCMSDGYLLQPSAPMRSIDSSFALTNYPIPRVKNVHAIMATHTLIEGAKWSHVLIIGLQEAYTLSPADLGDDVDTSTPLLAWTGYQSQIGTGMANVTVRSAPFTAQAPLQVPAYGYSDFGLWHLAPVWPQSKAAFLGELGKWVPVSEARVSKVIDGPQGLTVTINGVADEKVELAFAVGTKVSTTICKIGSDGTATAKFKGGSASC